MRQHDDSGRFETALTGDDVLKVFDDVDGLPVITSSDVTDRHDVNAETVRRRLGELHDDGVVDRRKSGRTSLWWRVADAQGDRAMSADRRFERAGRRETDGTPVSGDGPADAAAARENRGGRAAELPDELKQRAREILTDDAIQGHDVDIPRRREVLLDFYQEIHAAGPSGVRKSDLLELVAWEDEMHLPSAEGFWNNVAKGNLRTLPGVSATGEGGAWVFDE